MKVKAKIENVELDTSIWFDTKLNRHLLPVKAAIRNKAQLEVGKIVEVSIWV